MESWLFGPMRVRSLRFVAIVALVAIGLVSMPDAAGAQSVSTSDRDALVRLHVDRGGRAEDVDPLIRLANDAGAKGLPVRLLISKIREGIAKRATPAAIEGVVLQLAVHLETATGLLRDQSASGAEREAAVALLAEALGLGVTPDEVASLLRQSEVSGGPPTSPERLASAARGLSSIKESRLPAADGAAVMLEALRQGFKPHEMVDLGREIKRRERDYREGRASLLALRDAIARGSRPDRLFRDSRPATRIERPTATRPDPTTTRDRPQPDRPARPDRPGGDPVR